MVKRFLTCLTLIAAALPAYPYISDTLISFADLGAIKANIDHKLGLQKYYFYGYTESEVSSLMIKKLRTKNIEAVFRGCEIGGPGYSFEMTYNRTVRQYLPDDYLKLSEDDLDAIRRSDKENI
jgi:hypothetical protein